MFGHQAGGGMWPHISSASGAPPGPPNGVPFNSLYSGLGPPPQGTASAAHHLTQFVQPNPYTSSQSAMMQRQLGHSHLGISSRPQPGLMLPPSSNNMRVVELQEKRRQEMEKRKRAEEERKNAAKASEEFNSSLFDEPTKIGPGHDDQVAQVLGKFDQAQSLIKMDHCIGVDFVPPSPAPVQHVIGGEDDEFEGGHNSRGAGPMVHNPATAMYGGHQISHHGHHLNHHKRPHQNAMRPPPSRPAGYNRGHAMKPPAAPAAANPETHSNSFRMKEARNSIPKLNLERVNNSDSDIDKIFSEMINPLRSGVAGEAMPPPLSAIITPRVTKHEGNQRMAAPKYFSTVSPPPLKPTPEPKQPQNQQNRMIQPIIAPPPAPIQPISEKPGNSRLSEDSESDHEKMAASTLNFNPCVNLIEKKPSAMTKNHTTSESSSDDSSSDDSSTDDENHKKHKNKKSHNLVNKSEPEKEMAETANNEDMDNSFSLGNLINKVKKPSPGPASINASASMASEVSPEDISELLSQKRSPFPDNLIMGASETKPLLEISRPLSPLSPPPSQRKKSYRPRSSHKKTPIVASMEDSSDEELEAKPPPPVKISSSPLKKSSPSKPTRSTPTRPGPKKSALAQKTAPASILSSSSEDEIDDEAKDESYGVSYKKSPVKSPAKRSKKGKEIPTSSSVPKEEKVEESAKKRAAISRIFPVKKSASPATTKTEVVIKTEGILKRLDGRPILMCRIPYSAIDKNSSSKKRERKLSTCSSTSSSSKKHKKSESVEVKPEATNLMTLPGYASARNLMPPPDKKLPDHVDNAKVDPESNNLALPSYMEDEFQVYMSQAKKLKHEADRDCQNRERQAMKYLEAVLYFILCGNKTESQGDHASAYTMYKETLNLVGHVSRGHVRSKSDPSSGTSDNKLAILSLRVQSLLYLRLYKLRRRELRECQEKLEDLLKIAATNGLLMSPGGSPTPSPAGSEESGYSKSSGYTSSGELPITPASQAGAAGSSAGGGLGGTMSVPHILMHQQYHYSYYLTQCHELWELAEVYSYRGHCQEFIAHLDQSCGPLTLHSTLKDLVKYTQAGLDYLAKERESLHRARRL